MWPVVAGAAVALPPPLLPALVDDVAARSKFLLPNLFLRACGGVALAVAALAEGCGRGFEVTFQKESGAAVTRMGGGEKWWSVEWDGRPDIFFYSRSRRLSIFERVGLLFWADSYNIYSSKGLRGRLGAVKGF